MRARRRSAGFTLVEVLVALAIVGLALGTAAATFGNSLTAHETAADAEAALAVAEEQLALAAASPRPGNAGGNFAGRFAWRTTVAPYDDGDKATDPMHSLPVLYHVAVSVAWRDGRRSREVALSTLRLGPAPP
jgi:general secretion pathway protein I